MLSSAEPLRRAIDTILALERACVDAEAALVERRWDDFGASLRTQSALTAALQGLFREQPEIAPQRDERVMKRLRGVLAYREDQLRRLRSYHAHVGERLQAIGRVRAIGRTIGKPEPRSRVLDTQS
jgi:hypothetical protein